MLVLNEFHGRKVGILGAARSGIAVAKSMIMAGAEVFAFDDSAVGIDAAIEVGCRVGQHTDIADLNLMVVSPGIPLTHPAPHPVIEHCIDQGIPLTCDVDLFVRAAKAVGQTVIAVTGTNGKSTTTALIAHLLRCAGKRPLVGGNIGTPVFELSIGDDDRPVVLEVSSFQLDLCSDLAPDIAVWLNLSPDHLDRHGDLAGYIAAKSKIFAGQTEHNLAIVGVDDPSSAGLETVARRVTVSTEGDADIQFTNGRLVLADGGRIDFAFAPSLRGAHNAQNAAIAYAVVREMADLSTNAWQSAFESFVGLPHRMEVCASCEGVSFINDSKATNPDAAAKSLASYENIFWIAGGKAKPGGFRALAPLMEHVTRGYAIGHAAAQIESDLGEQVSFNQSGTLPQAMIEAFSDARGSDAVVLLAPACASFDQFESFEARGDMFRSMASDLCASGVPA